MSDELSQCIAGNGHNLQCQKSTLLQKVLQRLSTTYNETLNVPSVAFSRSKVEMVAEWVEACHARAPADIAAALGRGMRIESSRAGSNQICRAAMISAYCEQILDLVFPFVVPPEEKCQIDNRETHSMMLAAPPVVVPLLFLLFITGAEVGAVEKLVHQLARPAHSFVVHVDPSTTNAGDAKRKLMTIRSSLLADAMVAHFEIRSDVHLRRTSREGIH
eukprot:gnl/MRDRNA2_/MRDRNA2_407874_c0_seq1.p1 gnl/MRDRNA2_/MRDRNA2_407874_c0~~gnl/MRDRNA2_/MRDRNA2_407874_c0_seq1.p1  ORF type:complete len:225 (+),score=33.70 gnl/MRDRNA2_/MRDRNA2_407874_c0_seq1:22-675(+)